MVVPRVEKQQVIGSLKATGSTDPDVLCAKKEEMLDRVAPDKVPFHFAYVVGGAMSVTIVGAVVGIPVIPFGRAVKKTIRSDQSVADAGLLEYVKSFNGKTQAAVA